MQHELNLAAVTLQGYFLIVSCFTI